MYELINRFFYFSDHKIISVSDHTLLISDLNNIKMGSTIFQKQSPSGVLRRRCLCSIFTGEHPCQSFYNVTSVKQSLFSDGSDTQQHLKYQEMLKHSKINRTLLNKIIDFVSSYMVLIQLKIELTFSTITVSKINGES